MKNRTGDVNPPPVTVVVMGPPGVGKSTLIKALVKRFTKHTLTDVKGPITVVSGKNRRITFYECGNDLNSMLDLAKIADLALLMIDASYGFEMETFEFVSMLQTHGFPKVMGVLTHMDGYRSHKTLANVKKTIKHRFWTEIFNGAKLFYMSGLMNGTFLKREVHNLSLYLSRMKLRPLVWRNAHPFVLVDRMEDVTPPAAVEANPACDRSVALYGFVKGTHLKPGQAVCVPGAGDFRMTSVVPLEDPVPLPEQDPEKRKKRRTLNTKETMLYAPMSNVGGVLYDADAVYINLPNVHFSKPETLMYHADDAGDGEDGTTADAAARRAGGVSLRADSSRAHEGVTMVQELQGTAEGLDSKLHAASLSLFKGSAPMTDAQAAAAGIGKDAPGAARAGVQGGADSDDEAWAAAGTAWGSDVSDSDDDGQGQQEQPSASGSSDSGSDSDSGSGDMASKRRPRRPPVPPKDPAALAAAVAADSSSGDEESAGGTASDAEGDTADDSASGSDSSDAASDSSDADSDVDLDGGEAPGGASSLAGDVAAALAAADAAGAEEDASSHDDSDSSSSSSSDSSDSSDSEDEGGAVQTVEASAQERSGSGGGALAAAAAARTDLWQQASTAWAARKQQRLNMTELVYGIASLGLGEHTAPSVGAGKAKGKGGTTLVGGAADGDSDDELFRLKARAPTVADGGAVGVPVPPAGGSAASRGGGSSAPVSAASAFSAFVMYGGLGQTSKHDSGGAGAAGGTGMLQWGSEYQRINAVDSSVARPWRGGLRDWGDEDVRESIRNRFVTGNWGEGGAAGGGDAEEEVYGDFEDLEAGSGSGSGSDASDGEAGDDEVARLMGVKAQKKAAFNSAYDSGKFRKKGSRGAGDDAGSDLDEDDEDASGSDAEKSGSGSESEEESDVDGPEGSKARAEREEEQRLRNEGEFEAEGDESRLALTGFKPGYYVRIQLDRVPPEFVTNFRTTRPCLVGGLLPQEEGMAMTRVRVKRHRWHPRILKSADALVISLGWRRFQTLPTYFLQDHNERMRYLKYTPEFLHCQAAMWAPVTPPNTGFMAFQNISDSAAQFRVAALGVTLEMDAHFKIVKKLKLVGTPMKIHKNTALIRGMFNSDLEVAKFEGAAIRTVSGLRGEIKRAVKEGPEGTYRASFEDKLLMSDIVFVRTWAPVEPIKFYNPVYSLLAPPPARRAAVKDGDTAMEGPAAAGAGADAGAPVDEDAGGRAGAGAGYDAGLVLLRPIRAVRKEKAVPVPIKADSQYKPIERVERKFNPLFVPPKLQAALPYASKPKQQSKRSGGSNYLTKRAVVMDAAQKKRHTLVQQIQTVTKLKEAQEREAAAKRHAAHQIKLAKTEALFADAKRSERKRRYKAEGIQQAVRASKSARKQE